MGNTIEQALMSYLDAASAFDAGAILSSFEGVDSSVVEGEQTDGSLDMDWSEV